MRTYAETEPEPELEIGDILRMLLTIDCSQSSVFSYSYSIVECADRIARDLDASAKRKT